MATRRKTKARRTTAKKTSTGRNCKPTPQVSDAGHHLRKKHSSRAGSVLSKEGKLQKAKRLGRGCLSGIDELGFLYTPKRRKKKATTKRKKGRKNGNLNGPPGTFQLTDKQRCKLPITLQKAIVRHHAHKERKSLVLTENQNADKRTATLHGVAFFSLGMEYYNNNLGAINKQHAETAESLRNNTEQLQKISDGKIDSNISLQTGEESELIKRARLFLQHDEDSLRGIEQPKVYRFSDASSLIEEVVNEKAKLPKQKNAPEVQLVFKRGNELEQKAIKSSAESAEILRQIFKEGAMDTQEHALVLFLSRANRLRTYYYLSVGGVNGTIMDKTLIFAAALKCLASGIIICHNHPSGQLIPSDSDRNITREIYAGAPLLGMQLLDHIILTSEGYYSFSDEGLL